MKRRLLTIALAAMLSLGAFGGVMAQGNGNNGSSGGCKEFGQAVAENARGGGIGAGASAIAKSGNMKNWVHGLHAVYCPDDDEE
jgi:hypothetical protein